MLFAAVELRSRLRVLSGAKNRRMGYAREYLPCVLTYSLSKTAGRVQRLAICISQQDRSEL